MVSRAFTVAFEGVEARLVEVQCTTTPGLPYFGIVGLPDKAVSEARERVRAALSAMAIALPSKRITINLSPANLPKEGSHFDLPICRKRVLTSTCRSPWPCWQNCRSSRKRMSRRRYRWGSCPWMVG